MLKVYVKHAGWAIKSNYPNLNSGRVFRLDWFILFLQFVTISFISLASISKLIPTVRAALLLLECMHAYVTGV